MSKRKLRARSILLAFGLTLSFLALSVTGFLLLRATERARHAAQARVTELATNISLGIDREIERHIAVLNTLSTLPSLLSADWPAFYQQASTALRDEGYIVLVDTQLRQIVNTFVPYGKAPELTGDPPTALRVLKSKNPEISDRFESLVAGASVFNIDIPVLRDGEVKYVLMYGRKTEYLRKVLGGIQAGTVKIFDRNHVLLADSQQSRPLTADQERNVTKVWATSEPTVGTEVRSKVSGWLVRVEVPLRDVTQPIQFDFLIAALVASVGFGIAVGGAIYIARQLTRDLEQTAAAARALSEGREVSPHAAFVLELGIVANAISNASQELARRERQAQMLSRELHHRVKNVIAIVHALVNRTVRNDLSAEQIRKALNGRLQSLALAQDLLLKDAAHKGSLKDLIRREVSAFSDNVVITGDDIFVGGSTLQTFALMVHELATNSLKHGALKQVHGMVMVTLSLTLGEEVKRFCLRWEERGASVESPTRKGFGTQLLLSAFASPTTRHTQEFLLTGLLYEIDMPADQFEIEKVFLADEQLVLTEDGGAGTAVTISSGRPGALFHDPAPPQLPQNQ